jgi:hypothetical protein
VPQADASPARTGSTSTRIQKARRDIPLTTHFRRRPATEGREPYKVTRSRGICARFTARLIILVRRNG